MYVKVAYKRHNSYPFKQGDTIEVEDKIYPPFFEGDTDYPNGYYKITNPGKTEEGESWIIDIRDITKEKIYKLSKFRLV
jgi:hypothetical protein